MLILDTHFFYGVTVACIACSLVSFSVMLIIRARSRKNRAERGTGNRRRQPGLRLMLNIGAMVPLGVVGTLLLWVWWSLWDRPSKPSLETLLEMVVACVTIYSVLLMGAITAIRHFGRNKPSAGGVGQRSHPLLRKTLDVAGWIPFMVMVSFFLWAFTSN